MAARRRPDGSADSGQRDQPQHRLRLLQFSRDLNCLLGGTGAGKSLLIELVRFALDQQTDAGDFPQVRKEVDSRLKYALNPDRDLGPQLIHGITAAEARRAPKFEQIAGHVAGLLRGRVLVAHNLHFDASFLRTEYKRAGFQVPIDPVDGLCTMRLASHFLPSAGRSLYDCCRAAGLPPHRAHSALHDARAAGQLLVRYLR